MAMAQGSFFLLLIFFSSFISTNNTLHASASNQAQHSSLALSSTPSNRMSIHCQPRRMGITKCNRNSLASLVKGTPLGGTRVSLAEGTPIGGICCPSPGNGGNTPITSAP